MSSQWPLVAANDTDNRYRLPSIGIGNSLTSPMPTTMARAHYAVGEDLSSTKLAHLEGRVDVNEKASRALLEETVRLQGELKTRHRHSDDLLNAERAERQQLARNTKANNEMLERLLTRMGKLEDQAASDNKNLVNLAIHSKQFEKMAVEQQHDLRLRNEQLSSQVESMTQEIENIHTRLEEFRQAEESKMSFAMEELRQLKSRVEIQSMEVAESSSAMRSHLQRTDVEIKSMSDSFKGLKEDETALELATSAMRADLDAKVRTVEEEVAALQRRANDNLVNGKVVEEDIGRVLGELKIALDDQVRISHTGMEELRASILGVQRNEEAERTSLLDKVRQLAEMQSKKQNDRDQRLKTEAFSRLMSVEGLIKEEREHRVTFEDTARNEVDQRWKVVQAKIDEELGEIRAAQKVSKMKDTEIYTKLNESISLLERSTNTSHRGLEQVLRAEIKQRQKEDEKGKSNLNEVVEKLENVTVTFDERIQDISASISISVEESRASLKRDFDESQQEGVRTVADVETRISQQSQQIQYINEQFKKELDKLRTRQHSDRQESVAAVTQWQKFTEDTMKDIESRISTFPEQATKTEERIKMLKSDMDTRFEAEKASHQQDSRALQLLVSKKANEDSLDRSLNEMVVSVQRVETKLHDTVSKVQRTDHGVSVLQQTINGKLAAESNMRVEAIMDLKRDLSRMRAQNDFLLKQRDFGASMHSGSGSGDGNNGNKGSDIDIASHFANKKDNTEKFDATSMGFSLGDVDDDNESSKVPRTPDSISEKVLDSFIDDSNENESKPTSAVASVKEGSRTNSRPSEKSNHNSVSSSVESLKSKSSIAQSQKGGIDGNLDDDDFVDEPIAAPIKESSPPAVDRDVLMPQDSIFKPTFAPKENAVTNEEDTADIEDDNMSLGMMDDAPSTQDLSQVQGQNMSGHNDDTSSLDDPDENDALVTGPGSERNSFTAPSQNEDNN